ncbi:hypothetical protein OJJOAM_003772 [Cupriavidus sp. H18C1]
MSRTIEPLRTFVAGVTSLMEGPNRDEAVLLDGTRPLLQALVARDDWLPDELAQPHPTYYQQYLLYGDPLDRFSVVSFVWGAGPADAGARSHGVGLDRRAARRGDRHSLSPR